MLQVQFWQVSKGKEFLGEGQPQGTWIDAPLVSDKSGNVDRRPSLKSEQWNTGEAMALYIYGTLKQVKVQIDQSMHSKLLPRE